MASALNKRAAGMISASKGPRKGPSVKNITHGAKGQSHPMGTKQSLARKGGSNGSTSNY